MPYPQNPPSMQQRGSVSLILGLALLVLSGVALGAFWKYMDYRDAAGQRATQSTASATASAESRTQKASADAPVHTQRSSAPRQSAPPATAARAPAATPGSHAASLRPDPADRSVVTPELTEAATATSEFEPENEPARDASTARGPDNRTDRTTQTASRYRVSMYDGTPNAGNVAPQDTSPPSQHVTRITDDGDDIVMHHPGSDSSTTSRPASPDASGAAGNEPASGSAGDDDSDPFASQTQSRDEDTFATPDCPVALSPGSTREQAELMLQQYGCKYMNSCRIRNDGSDDILCKFLFTGART